MSIEASGSGPPSPLEGGIASDPLKEGIASDPSEGGLALFSPPAGGTGGLLRSLPAWGLAVGVIVIALYVLLLPFIVRTWRATGDEPHYLLTAHSLVYDGDFDLANNYANLDYLAFYLSRDIAPQIRTAVSGEQILNHGLGLPLLIAPAYAWGGRLGVLLFQAILAGLLATLTFKLAAHISGDKIAAIIATLLVMAAPPLPLYTYLVYPELSGALLTTLVIYLALSRDEPLPREVIAVALALLFLPWLNRRFMPLALLLALIVLWSWRRRDLVGFKNLPGLFRNPDFVNLKNLLGLFRSPGLWPLIAALLSIISLVWFNAQFEMPDRVDITAPITTVSWMGLRLVRGVGWLVDQQRGLFVYGPIYIAALWGLPLLVGDSLKQRRREWLVITPFLLSLGVTAAAGGFWIAWELGPRFLVVVLPTLAPLLALAWRQYRRVKIWVAFLILLTGLSLYHTAVIIQNPELPYKSSLALHYEETYKETFDLPLTEILPDLAGYTTIFASQANPATNRLATEGSQTVWAAAAGQTADLIQPTPLPALPFGHYRLTWPLQTEANIPPDTELLRLSATLLGGGPVFNKLITQADLDDGTIRYDFLNSNVDRWRTPLVFQAVTTGHSDLRAGDIRFTPDPFYALFLPYLYLALFAGGAGLSWVWGRRMSGEQPFEGDRDSTPSQPPPARGRGRDLSGKEKRSPVIKPTILGTWLAWSGLLLILIMALGYLLYQQRLTIHTYDAADFYHFVGQPLADAAAEDGRAWQVDPQIDPPQKAIYGPFDIYEAGTYQVAFRMKLAAAVESEQAVAHLQISATDSFDELVAQPLRPEHFTEVGSYHLFVLTADNPRRQALSFDVHYTGVAPLVIDGVAVERVGIEK